MLKKEEWVEEQRKQNRLKAGYPVYSITDRSDISGIAQALRDKALPDRMYLLLDERIIRFENEESREFFALGFCMCLDMHEDARVPFTL